MNNPGLTQAQWYEDLQQARTSEKNANTDIANTSVNISMERTQYFEKLAIGSGATIAAIISFLGVRNQQLRPHWIFRTALVSLVAALVAALTRNNLYPHYVLAAKHRIWMERQRTRLLIEQQGVEAGLMIVDDGSSGLIEPVAALADYKSNDASLSSAISLKTRRESQFNGAWVAAEYLCLIALIVAMISLVWLALRNF